VITLIQSYRTAFSGEHGERVLDDLMRRAHLVEGTYTEDARASAFLQGEQSMGLHILHMVFGPMPEPETETETGEEPETAPAQGWGVNDAG